MVFVYDDLSIYNKNIFIFIFISHIRKCVPNFVQNSNERKMIHVGMITK